MNKRCALIHLYVILLLSTAGGCSVPSSATPIATNTSRPSPVRPTPTITVPPQPLLLPIVEPTRTPCNSSSYNLGLAVFPSKRQGWCEAYLPLRGYRGDGYSLQFPEGWTVRLGGAEAMNLVFNENSQDSSVLPLFIQRTGISDITLENLDSAVYGFEMSRAKPLVSPSEQRLEKKTVTVGSTEGVNVLWLRTLDQDYEIQRYFLPFQSKRNCKSDCSVVYVFQVSFKQAERYSTGPFLKQLEDVIASTRFVIR